jgi:hypothetical protein
LCQALDEVLLPKGAKARARTAGLVFIWERLDEARHRTALRVILADRARAQSLIGRFLEVGARSVASSHKPTPHSKPWFMEAGGRVAHSG